MTDDRIDDLGELGGMCGREKDPWLTRESPVRDRTMWIDQISTPFVDLADGYPHVVVGVPAAGDVAAHRVYVAAVQPRHSLEVTGIADVHRIRERADRRPRREESRREIRRDDVVRVGRRDESIDRESGSLRHQPGGQGSEVPAWRTEGDRSAEASRSVVALRS